jgi:hypothetical protein
VAARRGNLQGALDLFLAFDFREVHLAVRLLLEQFGDVRLDGRDGQFAFPEARGFAQVGDGDDLQTSLTGWSAQKQIARLPVISPCTGLPTSSRSM